MPEYDDHDLERRLREQRSEAGDEFVDRIAAGVRSRRASSPRPRLTLAFALSLAVLVSLVAFGGVGAASSAFQSSTAAVRSAVGVLARRQGAWRRLQAEEDSREASVPAEGADLPASGEVRGEGHQGHQVRVGRRGQEAAPREEDRHRPDTDSGDRVPPGDDPGVPRSRPGFQGRALPGAGGGSRPNRRPSEPIASHPTAGGSMIRPPSVFSLVFRLEGAQPVLCPPSIADAREEDQLERGERGDDPDRPPRSLADAVIRSNVRSHRHSRGRLRRAARARHDHGDDGRDPPAVDEQHARAAARARRAQRASDVREGALRHVRVGQEWSSGARPSAVASPRRPPKTTPSRVSAPVSAPASASSSERPSEVSARGW